MSLSEAYLSNLQRAPSKNESHNWADYLELLCLANVDGELSASDIIDRLSPRQKDLKEGDFDFDDVEADSDTDENHISSNRARVSDKWDTKLSDWFSILAMRCKLHGGHYPFVVEYRELKLKNTTLSRRQQVYVYLLLCSNLYLFPKREAGKFANSFELFAMDVFRSILPKNFEVHLFGANQYNTSGKLHSRQSFWSRVGKLSELLNEKLSQKLIESDYPPKNTGDEGLDIVAWLPTQDTLTSRIIFFGQCACGRDWIKKQLESSYDVWASKLELSNYTINNMFIPFCYRKPDGGWFKPASISKTHLVDRKRLLDFCFQKRAYALSNLPISKEIKEVFSARESVV